jgi:hypothetical protein
MSFARIAQSATQSIYMSKLPNQYTFPLIKEAHKLAIDVIFTKLPKVNNCLMGKKSPNGR